MGNIQLRDIGWSVVKNEEHLQIVDSAGSVIHSSRTWECTAGYLAFAMLENAKLTSIIKRIDTIIRRDKITPEGAYSMLLEITSILQDHTIEKFKARLQLFKAVKELSRRDRPMLILYCTEDMTPAEIAEVLGEQSAGAAGTAARIVELVKELKQGAEGNGGQ